MALLGDEGMGAGASGLLPADGLARRWQRQFGVISVITTSSCHGVHGC